MKKFQKLFDPIFSIIKKSWLRPSPTPAALWKIQSPKHSVNEKVLKFFELKFGVTKKVCAQTIPPSQKNSESSAL